jgi:CheY-like chemotaxis protein
LRLPRVLLVDDTPEVLALCAELLKSNYDIVGTVADGKSAIAAVAATRPDVVVLDVSMPGLDGIDVVRRLRTSGCLAPIVFLSGEMEFMMSAMEAGGSGFVTKARIVSDLSLAIREALAGRVFLSTSE